MNLTSDERTSGNVTNKLIINGAYNFLRSDAVNPLNILLIPLLLIDEDYEANNLLIVINAFRPLSFHLYTIGNLLYISEVQIKTCFE